MREQLKKTQLRVLEMVDSAKKRRLNALNAKGLKSAPAVAKPRSVLEIKPIQSIPVKYYLHKITTWLQQIDRNASLEDINAKFPESQLKDNIELQTLLKENPRINYEKGLFSYKSKHDVRNKRQLEDLIIRFPLGIDFKDLEDSYTEVKNDLTQLKNEQKIISIKNKDTRRETHFPKDTTYLLPADKEFLGMWKLAKIPLNSLEQEMKQDNLFVHETLVKKDLFKEKPKKKKKTNRIRSVMTNKHLLDDPIWAAAFERSRS